MRRNPVKRALNKGMVQVGTWLTTLRSPQVIQIFKTAGFDFVYIDMEHSSFSLETVGDLCFAALTAGIVPIVRPPAKSPCWLSRPLDAGAMGLLIPNMKNADEAAAVVRAVKYPPLGERGLNLRGVHTGFARADGQQYIRDTNRETLLIVQIESRIGVQNIDEILAVDGIDGAVVGRGDLSNDLGVPGETNHVEVIKCVEEIIAACNRKRKIPGLLVQNVASAREWIKKGIRLVPYSNDVAMLLNTASRAIQDIRGS